MIPPNPGGIQDEHDSRDFQWSELGSAIAPFDWEEGYDIEKVIGKRLEVNDQGASTSCGGQAFSKYAEALEALKTDNTIERRSAAWVYRQTAVVQNGVPQGSRLRDNSDLFRNIGICLEVLCPSYFNGKPPTDAYILGLTLNDVMRQSAKTAKGLSYLYVGSHIDLYAQAIRENGGLVMLVGGMDNGTWKSRFPKPPTYRQWGHFVYAGKAKLINGKKYIGILNSWGEDTGDDGWQWIGEDYFASGFVESAVTFVLDTVTPPPTFTFSRDLTVGARGVDVKALQQWLNRKGYPVAISGPGSPGMETTYFGTLTRDAVSRLQKAVGIKPNAGYFGPITRGYVNSNQ